MDDIQEIKKRFEQIRIQLDLNSIKDTIQSIEKESEVGDFWTDPVTSGAKMKELARLKGEVDQVEMLELLVSEFEENPNDEKNYKEMIDLLEQVEEKLFLSGKYDSADAILSIHAGQGGTEAMDWTEMLLRMYLRFFENRGWKTEIINQSVGEEAGLKEVGIKVQGEYSYGYLKHEMGTHRLVRLSPFNADNLRQTSFAGVEVVPVVDTSTDVELSDGELEFSATHSGGPGGQNVNKVATAVRIVHKPTGITVKVTSERSQHRNRELAISMLKGKLAQLQEEKLKKEAAEIKGDYKVPGWGNQIRSYVLHPYQMVKDHRTGVEVSDAEGVLDGKLDELIEAEIRKL